MQSSCYASLVHARSKGSVDHHHNFTNSYWKGCLLLRYAPPASATTSFFQNAYLLVNNTCLLNMPSVEQGPQSVYVPLLIPYLLHTVYSSCWMSWRTAICCCARNVNIDGHSRHSKVSWHVLSPHSLTHLTSIHIPYAWIQCLGHLQQGVQKMRVKHPTMAPLLPAKYVIEYEPPWKSVYVYTHHTA